jgi:hypothetical protein
MKAGTKNKLFIIALISILSPTSEELFVVQLCRIALMDLSTLLGVRCVISQMHFCEIR